MGVYDLANASDAAIQDAIVEFVTNAASQNGAEAIAAAPRVKGAVKLADIQAALGIYDARVATNVAALVDASTLLVDMTSPLEREWTYSVA